MHRFTRLTNAFSRKVENHEAAVAFHYMLYNFARVHQTLRVTPAMGAGIADHVWTPDEIVRLLDQGVLCRIGRLFYDVGFICSASALYLLSKLMRHPPYEASAQIIRGGDALD